MTDEQAQQTTRFRGTLARASLVGGVGLALVTLLPAVPRRQTLVVEMRARLHPVRRIDIAWTPEGDVRASGGVTLRFPGAAPEVLRQTVSLPNGNYLLDIAVEREAMAAPGPGRKTTQTYQRRVTLQGDETRLSLKESIL